MVEASTAISLRLDLPGGGWIDVAAASHRGPRRQNEDNFLAILPDGAAWRLEDECLQPAIAPNWGNGTWLRVAVMDGMGGHALGRELAEAATIALLTQPPKDNPEDLRSMVMDLHTDLMARAGGPGAGGCTLVMADIDLARGALTLINVGDSRGWFRHRSITHQVTHDHRAVEFAYRDGEVGAAEYAEAIRTKTNRLSQALGFGSFQAFSRTEETLNPSLRIDLAGDVSSGHADVVRLAVGSGDLLLLGSDGLLAGEAPEELASRLAEGGDLAAEVSRIATGPAARDNTTAMMVGYHPRL